MNTQAHTNALTTLAILVFAASLLAASSASAASGTWLGNGLDWNNSAAWSGGIIADGSTFAANFTGVNITSDVSMALGANRTIDDITFTDATTSSHNLTLTGSTLTLAGTPSINVTQSDRNLTISSLLAGSSGFTKSGQGTLTLTGSNSITGATVISGGGKLVLDYGTNDNRKLSNNSTLALNGGTIVLKGGTATENMTGGTTFNTVNAGTFFVRDGGTSKINLNGFSVGTGSAVSFSHDGMATTDRTNTIGILGAWFTVGDSWATNATNAADGNIVKYTGGATFTNALVTDNNTNADLSGGLVLSGSKTVNTLRIVSTADNQVLTLGANNISTSNLTGNGTSTGGGLLYAGGANGNYTISGTTGRLLQFNQNGQGQLINVYSGTLTVDAIVGSGSSPLVKTGEGTLVLTRDNAYGALRVYQGVVRLGHNNALENTSTVQNGAAIELSNGISIGAFASTITGTGISNGGALRSVATTTSSFAGAITIGTGGARINSDSTGTLTLTGGVVTADNTVTFGGAGNINVNTAAISGGGGLVKDGAGTTTLSAANTYTGGTTISGGTLEIGGVGTLGSGSYAGAISIANTSGGTLKFNSTATQTLSGQITGNGALVKANTGTLTLSGNNSYAGVTTVNNGTLILGNDNALGSSAVGSETTINGGASDVINLTNSTVLDLGTAARTLSESFNLNGSATGRATIYNNAAVAHVLNGNIDATSDAGGHAQIRSDNNGGSITVNGNITGTVGANTLFYLRGVSTSTSNRLQGDINISGNLAKTDGGTWTIGDAGSNTFAWGNTNVQVGTLRMGRADVLPSTTVVTVGQNDALSATLDLNGFSQTVAGIQLDASPGTGTRTITSSTAATLTVGDGNTYSYGGVLTGSLALTKTGAGNQILTSTNSYTGGTRIDDGILTLGHATDTLADTGAVNVNNGGTLALGANSDIVGAVTLTSGSITGSGAGTLIGTGSAYDVRSGTISAKLGGTIGLTKSTGSTVTLTGVNSYTGDTTVSAGTLEIGGSGSINTLGGSIIVNGGELKHNSSASLTATVTVDAGGTVTGSGPLGKVIVDDGGVHAPGNSPGESVVVTEEWLNGGTYEWEIKNTGGSAGDPEGWDLITATTLDIDALTTNFDIDIVADSGGILTAPAKKQTSSWTILTYTNNISTFFDEDLFSLNVINPNVFGPSWDLVEWSIINTGSSLRLQAFNTIPEPSTAILAALGLAGLCVRRRRRK